MGQTLYGFIMLHRKMLDWEWYDDVNTKTVFLHLLLTANFEDKEWHGITVPRGAAITSIDSLSKKLGLSTMQVRTALKHLKSTNEITIKSTTKFSIITVSKYNEYQQSTNTTAIREQADIKQPANNQQHRNNVNKVNKDNNVNKVLAELPAIDGVYYVYEDLYNVLTDTYKQTDINESISNLKAYLTAHPEKQRKIRNTRSYVEMWVRGDAERNKCRKENNREYTATYDLEEYERASEEYMDRMMTESLCD